MGAGRVSLVQFVDDFLTRVATLAGRMSETAITYAILDIENEVVAWAWCNPHRDRTQS